MLGTSLLHNAGRIAQGRATHPKQTSMQANATVTAITSGIALTTSVSSTAQQYRTATEQTMERIVVSATTFSNTLRAGLTSQLPFVTEIVRTTQGLPTTYRRASMTACVPMAIHGAVQEPSAILIVEA